MTTPIPAQHLRTKRAYDAPTPQDGARILVDRLWPRGIKKEALALDAWEKALAPSTELRQWYGHEPAKWEEFQQRYAAELRSQPQAQAALAALRARAKVGVVTLIYASHEAELNNAMALRGFLLHPGLLG